MHASERADSGRSSVWYGAELVLVAALYYAAGRLGSVLDFSGPVAAIVWLPYGIGVTALYFRGLALWPAVLLADLLLNDYSALPDWVAIAHTAGNVVEVLLAAALLRHYATRGWLLGSIEGLTRLTASVALGAALSATVGVVSLKLGGVIGNRSAIVVWRTWWLGDFSGALMVIPFALAWFRPPEGLPRGRRIWEAIAVTASVAVLSEIAFSTTVPIAYVVFPALIWAAIRFRQRGATLATNIAVASAIWNTVHHDGPFAYRSITEVVLTSQIYIAVAEVTTLVLAVVVTEREQYADQLDASRARLIVAGDTERRRIERNLHDGAQQRLVALAMRLRQSAGRIRQAPETAPALVDEAEEEVQQALVELRELARGIHPAVLTTLGLSDAIDGIATRSLVPITIHEMPDQRLHPLVEATAYFVLIEAIANAQKHARASAIELRVAVRGSNVLIEIRDDGVGGARVSAGSGLQGLCDRVDATGGTVDITSTPSYGTRIGAQVPAQPRAL